MADRSDYEKTDSPMKKDMPAGLAVPWTIIVIGQ